MTNLAVFDPFWPLFDPFLTPAVPQYGSKIEFGSKLVPPLDISMEITYVDEISISTDYLWSNRRILALFGTLLIPFDPWAPNADQNVKIKVDIYYSWYQYSIVATFMVKYAEIINVTIRFKYRTGACYLVG